MESSLTLLGSGTSSGVPLIGCTCRVCRSRNPKNRRLRASAWLQARGKSILIDTSTDLRQQALQRKMLRVDAVLYTHPHADHISGIDEMRSYNFLQKKTIPLFGNEWTVSELRARYPYIFAPTLVEGGGIPLLELHEIENTNAAFLLEGIRIQSLSVRHGSKECLGYRFGSAAYVTDCHFIPEETLRLMEGLDLLILDCVKLAPHNTHFNLDRALEVVSKLKPKKTFLTHLGHDFDHAQWKRKLPKGVALAYDGLKLKVRVDS